MPVKQALLSVYHKDGLIDLSLALKNARYNLIASGGTAKAIRNAGIEVFDVSEITGFPEILGGRVKTLHPAVHGGILAQEDIQRDKDDLVKNHINSIDVVVCNLYPFKETLSKPGVTYEQAIEEIDIGGVTLLRAAAKNSKRVSILSNPAQYKEFIQLISTGSPLSQEFRNSLALAAFEQTADYDAAISGYFKDLRKSSGNIDCSEIALRYGVNPHQSPAKLYSVGRNLPIKVLHGSPGFINLLDAFNAYPLVKELAKSTGLPAAASFKHVSPAGVAVGDQTALSDQEKLIYGVDNEKGDVCGLAKAYSLARGCDRMSSFGDFIALSHPCDEQTARIIGREVSDGVIAPGYSEAALAVLAKKKAGKYLVIEIDPEYEPEEIETRQVFGMSLQQKRNDAKIDASCFTEIVSKNKELTEQAVLDFIVATTALKYTQSNSVCYAKNGMVVGMGAGQQSRIHCTRLAGDKADNWWLRHHPKVLAFKFKKESKRPERANAIDLYVTGQVSTQRKQWESVFEEVPLELTETERSSWINELNGVVCASDAFFPFPDNVHRLARSGVGFVAAPGGSVSDQQVFDAADSFKMVYCKFPYRLFHH